MDIVSVNQTFGFGGAETFNIALANYLSKSNLLHFYTNYPKLHKSTSNLSSHFVPFSVDFIGDWKGFLKGLFYLLPLQLYYFYIIFNNIHAEVFYFTGYIEKVLLTPWLKLFGKKVIWVEFAPMQTVLNKFWHFPELLYRLVSWAPSTVIFSSNHSLNKNNIYFPRSANLQVIYLGSPVPHFDYPKVPLFDVLCFSRLEPDKGQVLLIKAWKEVVQKVPKASLVIAGVGDTRYTQRLHQLVADLKLQKNIKFTGLLDNFYTHFSSQNLYSYLEACKFTVHPSVWPLEGFGLVITESFSMGKPVVAFNHPPGNEIIKSGYNGLLADSLTENIIYLLKNPKVLKKLSQNARLDFSKNYREDIYLQKYASAILS